MKSDIDFSVAGNVLALGDVGVEVKFQWPVSDVLLFGDVLVVRVEPDPGACFNENVFGVRRDGTIAWTIEARRHVYADSPYTSIIAKDGNVKLFNWDGDELLVDPLTGSVLSVRQGK